MKKNIINFITYISLLIPFFASGQGYFKNYYKNIDTTYSYWGEDVLNTDDNGFLITATKNIYDTVSFGKSLLKLSSSGDTMWAKDYNGWISCLIELSSGEFIGFAATPSSQYSSIGKFDQFGNEILLKDFHNFYPLIKSRIICDGNSLYLAGFDSNTDYSVVLKTDLNLNVLWTRKLIPSMDCASENIFLDLDSNGNIFIASSASSYWACVYASPIELYKLDGQGNIIWEKEIVRSDSVNISVTDLKCNINNSDYVTLSGTSYHQPGNSSFTVEVDSSGNLIYAKGHLLNPAWQESESVVNYSSKSIFLMNDTIVITDDLGNTLSTINDNYNILKKTYDNGLIGVGNYFSSHNAIKLLKLDSTMSSNCDGYVSVTDSILPMEVRSLSTPVINITVTLSINPDTIQSTSVSFVKHVLCSQIGVNEIDDDASIVFYPNPFNDELNISLNKNTNSSEINIFNITGEKVYSSIMYGLQETIKVKLNTGIYFVHVTNGLQTWNTKVIKQ
jgi:hypothetical protein